MLSLLLNADLYDPSPRGRSHLLVAGETIVWIGAEKPALPRGLAREWDLDGRRVIPGLIDGHVHLTGGGGEAGPAYAGAAGGAEPAHAGRRHHGGRRARDRRHDPDAGGAGHGRPRPQRRGAHRLLPHRRIPRPARDRHRRRAAGPGAHRPGARRRRAGDQRPPLEPAHAGRAAARGGRRARRRPHEREGGDPPPARGRRLPGSGSDPRRARPERDPGGGLQSDAREPAPRALRRGGRTRPARLHHRPHRVPGARRARTPGAPPRRWSATSTPASRRTG